MSSLPLPRLTITYDPGFVTAEQVGNSLIVNASIIVRKDDGPFGPVLDFLEGRCFSVQTDELIDDDSMWRCRSRYWLIRLHDVCPEEDDETHSCRTERHLIAKGLDF